MLGAVAALLPALLIAKAEGTITRARPAKVAARRLMAVTFLLVRGRVKRFPGMVYARVTAPGEDRPRCVSWWPRMRPAWRMRWRAGSGGKGSLSTWRTT